MPSPAAAPELERLLSWAALRGADVHGSLSIAPLPASEGGGRGLVAARALAAGTRLARIPLACCLTDEPVDAAAAAAPWPVRMASAILRAADAGEAWAPFVAALPREAVPVGAFAPWRTLKEAQLPHVLATASDTAWLLQHAARPACSDGAWRWALSLALSRTSRPDGCAARLLAPVFDMANHSFEAEPEIAWRWEAGALLLHTTRDVSAGTQLRISYGEHANDVFWLHYGWAPEAGENPHDRAVLFDDAAHAERWLEDEDAEGASAGGDASEEGAEEARAQLLCAGPGACCWAACAARLQQN